MSNLSEKQTMVNHYEPYLLGKILQIYMINTVMTILFCKYGNAIFGLIDSLIMPSFYYRFTKK